jgi:Conserved hypothetical protein 2217 (DUF2460)
MATFPKLKTNAVAQYPAARGLRYQNQTLRFLDGTEQRYRDGSGPLRQWVIQLSALDEGELAEMEGFFRSNEGQYGNFVFVDPWDGNSYPSCSLAGDQLDLTAVAEMQGQTSLTVVENRT